MAAEPGHAERQSAQAQRVLDGAVAHLHALETDDEAVTRFTAPVDDVSLVEQVFAGLEHKYPGLDIPGLVQQGSQEFADGVSGEIGRWASLDFLTIQLVARAYLDPDALVEKLREFSDVRPASRRVALVAEMDEALQDFGVARRDLFEALSQFRDFATGALDSAAVFRRLAKTAGELYESALPMLVWLRLLLGSGVGSDRYASFIQKDATHHTDRLRRVLPFSFADMPSYLRHAAHHGRAFDVDLSSDVVRIRLRSHSEEMSPAAYVDRVYALMETLLAVHWSISNWLELSGIPVPMADGSEIALGMGPANSLAFWLRRMRGVVVAESKVTGRAFRLTASLDVADVLSTAVVAAQQAGGQYTSVEVRITGTSGAPWHLSLADWDAHMDGDAPGGLEATMRLIRLRHACTRDTVCLLNQEDLEYAAIVVGIAVGDGSLKYVSQLREIRQLARAHHADVAEALAVKAMSAVRDSSAGSLRVEQLGRLQMLRAPAVPTFQALRIDIAGNATSAHS